MKQCDCYSKKIQILGWLGPDEFLKKEISVCMGTKEWDECSCGGDRSKCDFYPEVRESNKEAVCQDKN